MIDVERVLVSACVQHTPARDYDVVYQNLLRDLSDTAEVVTDPEPDGPTSTWRTYAECLRRTPMDVTHRLVLQDDVILCDHFIEGVLAAVRSRPDHLLSLFISGLPQGSAIAHMQACDRGEAWSVIDTNEWTPTQALVWPIYLIPPMLRYATARTPQAAYEGDDQVVAAFLRARSLYALQSMPSLVEHAHHSASSLPSGTSNVGSHRRALCWMGRETSYHPAHDVPWRYGAA